MKQIILTDKQAAQLREIMLDCKEVAYYVALAESVLDQLAEQNTQREAAVNILGIEIPHKLTTLTIRRTDWTPEPIHSTDDINRKWIGNRGEQVGVSYIRLLWNIETETELLSRRSHIAGEIQNIIADTDILSDDGAKRTLILGCLRTLYLIDCLLANGRQ